MPPQHSMLPKGGESLAPFDTLARWLAATALHCAIGLLLGVLAARRMRALNLHWSLASLTLVPIALMRAALGGWSLALAVAASVASVRGRRWHREDLEAGADLAADAARRVKPLALLAAALGPLAARWPRPAPPRTLGPGRLRLGSDERGRAVELPLADGHDGGGGRHMLVVGATGSGKTVTQALIAVAALRHGMGAVVVDPKGDERLREELAGAAELAGAEFLEWTPDGGRTYNPYARGSETEIADKALAGERFTEPHYLRQAQRYLGHAVRSLRCGGVEVSLAAIVELLDPRNLESLARSLPESQAAATHAYLDSLTPRQQSDLSGVRDRLAILAESDVGRWLDAGSADGGRVDLLEAIRARAVVYFRLEADRRPLLAQMLGSAIVQDLQTAVAAQQRAPVPTLVVIDEFSAVAAEQVVRLFARARSAGVSLLLGTQELSDLRLPGRERLLEQVMGNLSVLIAHRQVVPSSADLISSLAGTEGAWRVSRHSDGRTTRTRTREAQLGADAVMALDRGCAAVIALDGVRGARITRVRPADG